MSNENPQAVGAPIERQVRPSLVDRLLLFARDYTSTEPHEALVHEAVDELERLIADIGPLLTSVAALERENANLRVALAEQGIDEPMAVDMAANAVDLPQSADHAELMLKIGWMWLTMHAPERLKKKA